jgi:hypothetical protein
MNNIFYINRIICTDNYFIIMSGILSINETFLLLPNQSLSIEYKLLSCISYMKLWLISHFIITRLVENFLPLIIFGVQIHNNVILLSLFMAYRVFRQIVL